MLGLWGAMLEIPLGGQEGLSYSDRAEWRKEYLQLVFRPDNTSGSNTESVIGGESAKAGHSRLLSLLSTPNEHPVLAILRGKYTTLPKREDDSGNSELLFLSKQSLIARRLLSADALALDVQACFKQFNSQLSDEDNGRVLRSGLSEADRMIRMTCGLTVPTSRFFRNHPVEELERLDGRN